MKFLIVIFIVILWVALQEFLSTRNHFIFGLILPAFLLVSGVLFLIFAAKPGTETNWIFKFALLFGFSLISFFDGRKKIKDKNKKELKKMTIKDL